MNADKDFVASITRDVMTVLAKKRFFETLDAEFCLAKASTPSRGCDGTHAISTTILGTLGFEEEDTGEVLQVLQSLGGCCDCEVLFNVAEESRFKAEYWQHRCKQ